jgi:hypothetical protein
MPHPPPPDHPGASQSTSPVPPTHPYPHTTTTMLCALQRLIELIRQGRLGEALEFAQEYLAPQAEENPVFLEELGAWGFEEGGEGA